MSARSRGAFLAVGLSRTSSLSSFARALLPGLKPAARSSWPRKGYSGLWAWWGEQKHRKRTCASSSSLDRQPRPRRVNQNVLRDWRARPLNQDTQQRQRPLAYRQWFRTAEQDFGVRVQAERPKGVSRGDRAHSILQLFRKLFATKHWAQT
jgi:hypothetical protein